MNGNHECNAKLDENMHETLWQQELKVNQPMNNLCLLLKT